MSSKVGGRGGLFLPHLHSPVTGPPKLIQPACFARPGQDGTFDPTFLISRAHLAGPGQKVVVTTEAKWVSDSTDPKVREAAKAFSAADLVLTTRQAKAFENGVPTAHVVRLPGADHYVYLSNEADVLREMKSFFSTLR